MIFPCGLANTESGTAEASSVGSVNEPNIVALSRIKKAVIDALETRLTTWRTLAHSVG